MNNPVGNTQTEYHARKYELLQLAKVIAPALIRSNPGCLRLPAAFAGDVVQAAEAILSSIEFALRETEDA